MGMFDYVRCDWLPLADGHDAYKYQDAPFQTKDFECNLDLYHITEDGRLLKYKWVSDDNGDYNGRTLDTAFEFNGVFDFYDRRDWKAQFLNGCLIAVWPRDQYWTPDYEAWEYAGRMQREQKERAAMLAAMTPEEREAWRKARLAELTQSMADLILGQMNHTGFMRKFMEKR